eukprot:scaffold9501_cov90-Cylindrotheca_fusiformis.AAC.1
MTTKLPAIPGVWVNSKQCPFGSSVFDDIQSMQENPKQHQQQQQHYDRTMVSLQQSEGNLILHPCSIISEGEEETEGIPFGRARECPELGSTACPTTVSVTQEATLRQPKSNKKQQFVQLAVVGLVFSQQNELLITRRPTYMRSFPGAWVFPGGSVDADDNGCLKTAIAREVKEETGLDTGHEWTVQSIWESVFPTIPQVDTPIRRHHLVVYLSTRLDKDTHAASSSSSLKLCEEEVDGAAWLSPENIESILAQSLSPSSTKSSSTTSSSSSGSSSSNLEIDVITHAPSSIQKEPLRHLSGIYPQYSSREEDGGRDQSVSFGMAQGSLFALEEYWKQQKSSTSRY